MRCRLYQLSWWAGKNLPHLSAEGEPRCPSMCESRTDGLALTQLMGREVLINKETEVLKAHFIYLFHILLSYLFFQLWKNNLCRNWSLLLNLRGNISSGPIRLQLVLLSHSFITSTSGEPNYLSISWINLRSGHSPFIEENLLPLV